MIAIAAQQPASNVIVERAFTIDDIVPGVLMLAGGLLALLLVLVTPLVLQGVVIARPWLTPGGLVDRMRVGWAVYRYEFWLGVADVPRRRRRDLRRELHANLADATARTGSRQAVDALGSLRLLAARSKDPSRSRQPTWTAATTAGILVFTLLLAAQLLLAAGFVAGADASGVGHDVRGAVGLPGYTVAYSQQARGGFGVEVEGGLSILVLPLIAFVVVARPWRLIRTGGRA